MSTSNLKLALQEYDAQQRRQSALLEAQRIGNLIHIQEQQLVAARHLAKQRKNALRRQQQQLQQQQLQQLIQQQQQQSSQPAHYSVQCQPTLEALAESAVEDEDDSSQDNSAPCPLAARRAVRVAAKRASLLASSDNNSASSSQQDQLEHTRSEPETQPKPIRYVQHKRRPLEPFAVLAPRSQWKPDSHTNKCDNILCRKEFTLFGERRHHCRRCGNIFCAACLGHKEVLYDMRLASWITFPERLLASVFRPEDQQQHNDDDEPSSPASLSLSSSFESGSSHGSTCSKSYMDAKPIKRKAIWERGTNEYVPSPVPQAWRDQVIDLAQEHMVCNDCHDILQGRDTSTDKFYEQKAMMVQREEIAWALWLQGLDKWDTVLRKHGLTLRASPAQRKEDRKAAAFSTRRGSNVSSATAASTDSSSSSDSGSTKVDASVDFAGRPIHANLYAWPTAPASIRFTSKALEPAPKPAPRPKPTPSIFGTHNAHPMYLQTASRPSSSRQSSLLTLSDVQQKEQQHEEEEKMEEDRQKRYTAALQEFLCDAYAMGDICDEFQRVIYYDLPEMPNWHQKITDDIWRWGMDRLSSWRGDSYGGW